MKINAQLLRSKDVPRETGVFVPCDQESVEACRKAKLRTGERFRVDLRKPRQWESLKRAHALGRLIADSHDEFEGMDAHGVLKRLQIEANAGCDEMLVRLHGMPVTYRYPRSLAYETMDEIQFKETVGKMAEFALRKYLKWGGTMTGDDVIQLAERMADEHVA